MSKCVDLAGEFDMQICGNGAVYAGGRLIGTTAFG